MKTFRILVFVTISVFLVTSCLDDSGGLSEGLGSFPAAEGGTDNTVGNNTGSNAAEGLWRGITNTNRALSGVVLDDGTYWFIYSSIGNYPVIAGVAQGNGISNPDSDDNGFFTSDNGRDFNFEGLGVSDFTLDGIYWAMNSIVPPPRLDGSIQYSSSTTTFESSYDTDYDKVPNLTDIAGTYTGSAYTSGGPDFATVIFTSAGTINGSGASSCTFSGNVSPRASGNIYDVSITFDGGVCANGTSTVTGVAYFDAPTKQLTSVGLNSSRTDGFIYVGSKP